jgi:hypothetical protein
MHHIQTGCMRDIPGVTIITSFLTKREQGILFCVRGTSQLEGFHNHLRRILTGFHSLPKLVTCLLALFVFRWNIDGILSEVCFFQVL